MFKYSKSTYFMSAAIVMMQLFNTFGFSNGSELPLELLQAGANSNSVKTMDYARRMAFPLGSTDDNNIELPPHVEENLDLNAAINREDLVEQENGGMPKWLQMQLQTEDNHHQHGNNYPANILHKQSNKQQQQQQQHQHHNELRQAHTVSSSPLKRCSIEITNKIPGICQTMGTIGNACVSGEYLDVFNADCF